MFDRNSLRCSLPLSGKASNCRSTRHGEESELELQGGPFAASAAGPYLVQDNTKQVIGLVFAFKLKLFLYCLQPEVRLLDGAVEYI